jgi:hypothetical protein
MTESYEQGQQAGQQAFAQGQQAFTQGQQAMSDAANRMASQAAQASSQAAEATSAAVDDAVQRIRELTERFIEAARAAGNASLDAYERSLQNLVEFEERAAGASQLDWVSTIASAHAKFVQEVSNAYVSAAREMLK